ncbi:hypothetical protein HYY72_05620 [Candidatus Woesearchaeota archaeon]|nr:hypothetical protein [Candidatus Woesearchaeota archaeon]
MKLDFAIENYRKLAMLLVLILAAYLVLGSSFKLIVVVGIFVIVASFSTFYYNYVHSPVNFELVKFVTIISSVAYGFFVGISVGVITTIFSRIWSGRIDQRTLISIFGIAIISIAASMLKGYDIKLVGIALVALYHLITVPISLSIGDNPWFAMTYAATNLLINSFIFINLAPVVMGLASIG